MDLKNIKDASKCHMEGKIIEVFKEANDGISEEEQLEDVMEHKNQRTGGFGPLFN